MRELQLILSDDLTYAQTGERVQADETVVIALDSVTRELDLTAANAKKLRELMRPYLEAGHAPGQQSATSEEKSRDSRLVTARARQKAMREFADALGLRSDDGERPVYITPGGAYYYSNKLKQMYEAHQHGKL